MMFLHNRWYVAGWADQFSRELTTRTILNEHIVFYRTIQGEVIALTDRCPHRLTPLSRGRLIGNALQCGYHGLVLNADGKCTRMPTSATVPEWAQVKRYPVAELDGYVWIWMGRAEHADVSLITRFPCNTDPQRALARSELRINAHYQLIIDNLLDLSHAQYLHADSLGNQDFHRAKSVVTVEGTTVYDRRICHNTTAPAAFEHILGAGKKIDFWMDARMSPPGEYYLDVGTTPAGQSRVAGGGILSPQILTPETATSTMYYWTVCRDYDLENVALTTLWREAVIAAFVNDQTMIEAQQQAVGSHDIIGHGGHVVAADESGAAARRIIDELLSAEHKLSAAA
jgi:phenylpropionate dioxygenase-like ring-hydroxylating dioxygenase large terminal subunit